MSEKKCNCKYSGKRPEKYTCDNGRFHTKVIDGEPMRVTKGALNKDKVYELFVEHVCDTQEQKECMWFMWYKNGKPALKTSGVFDKEHLVKASAYIVGGFFNKIKDTMKKEINK